MNFENFSSHNALKKKALELEDLNMQIENMPPGEKREDTIIEADMLNRELNRMEKLTGIPCEEIMQAYEKLNKEMAEKGIATLLEELQSTCTEEDYSALKIEMANGFFDGFLKKIQQYMPTRTILAAACLVVITSTTWTKNVSANQLSQNMAPSYQVSLKTTISHEQQQEAETLEKAQDLVKEANQKAKNVLDNVDGFIKSLAQKEIIDEVAKNSDAIIAYLNKTSPALPILNGNTKKLVEIYAQVIKEIDGLGNDRASQTIRKQLTEKISLINTLVAVGDYSGIKKSFA